jgi:Gpi18-like mannosyltransferase
MQVFILWLVMRLFLSLYAASISTLRPLMVIEGEIPLWPPSNPIISWLERVFIAPWNRWDATWYARIVSQGYSADDGTAQFHPLYPWLGSILHNFRISPILSLLIISTISFFFLLVAFKRLASLDIDQKEIRHSILIFLLFPTAFVFFSPYPEVLFILLSIGCLYFARKRMWLLAGFLAGLATLTRQQGILLILPLGWEMWIASEKNIKKYIFNWRMQLSLLLIPLAYLFWLGYRAIVINDMHVDFQNINTLIYSLFISPSAVNVVPIQTFMWPWKAIWLAIEKLLQAPDLDIWVNIIASGIFIGFLVFAWKNLRTSYRIYTIAIILISFSYHTGPIHPYMGLPRHLMLAFPVFIGLTSRISKPWQRLSLVGISSLGMLFLLALYVMKAWVP